MPKPSSKSVTENQLLVYGSYFQIADTLQHYNRIQTTYRTFASTWLLATFLGIGYSLSSMEVNLPFHPLLTVALICFASSTGVSLIWYMDLIVCERIIAAAVFEGLELEKHHDWLPQVYTNVNKIHTLLGYVNLKSIFYIGCFLILFCAMGSSLTLFFYLKKVIIWMFIPIFIGGIFILISFFLIISTKITDPYIRLKRLKRHNGRIS